KHHDLGNLRSGYVTSRPEIQTRAWLPCAAALVAANCPVEIGCFYVAVKSVALKYVLEMRSTGCCNRPTHAQDCHLGEVAPCGVVARAESAVAISRNIPP